MDNSPWHGVADEHGLYQDDAYDAIEANHLERFCSLFGWVLHKMPRASTIDGIALNERRAPAAALELKRRRVGPERYGHLLMSVDKYHSMMDVCRGMRMKQGYFIWVCPQQTYYLDVYDYPVDQLRTKYINSRERPGDCLLVPLDQLTELS